MNQSDVAIPDKPADILNETERHLQQLTAALQKQDASAVHRADVTIRKLIAAIPEHASSDAKSEVNARVKEISDGAKTAHKLAHDDAWTEAAAHVKNAEASLAKLRTAFKETPP